MGANRGVFLRYQRELLDSVKLHQVVVVEKSRRTGYSWAAGAIAALTAGAARSAGGQDVFYMGYNLEMAREFIDYVGEWAKSFNMAGAVFGEFFFTDPDNPDKDIKAFRVEFASGFKVVALPSMPRALRGMQGLVIIDEAAFHDDLDELLKAAFALLIWGGRVLVISTHDGDRNPFNVLVNDIRAGRKPYHLLRCTFDDAIADGLLRRTFERQGKPWSREAEAEERARIIAFYGDGADEELFCIPSQSSGSWLPGPLIEARMTADAPILRWELPADFLQRPALEQKGMVSVFMDDLKRAVKRFDPDLMHALGFDFARVADLSVLWVFALDRLLRRNTALVVEMRRIPYQEQADVTETVLRAMPRPMGAAFDATGAGEYVAEAMGRKFGTAALREGDVSSGIIASIRLSTEWYRTEMPPLKAAFEDISIALPKDAEILDDLRLVKVIQGVPRIPDVRTGEKGKQRHGDAAVAIALAYHATRMRVESYGYQGARRDNERDEEHPWRRLDADLSLGGRSDGLW